jgi:hypothetical protein
MLVAECGVAKMNNPQESGFFIGGGLLRWNNRTII